MRLGTPGLAQNVFADHLARFGAIFVVWFGCRVLVPKRESLRAKTELYLENEAGPWDGFFLYVREGIDLRAHQF